MINTKKFERIMHDIKRVGKIVPIIRDEIDKNKRALIAGLLMDEIDRLIEDLTEEQNDK